MKYSLEKIYRIHNATCPGETIEIGPDADGLGMVELRYKDDDKTLARMCVTPNAIPMLIKALQNFELEEDSEG